MNFAADTNGAAHIGPSRADLRQFNGAVRESARLMLEDIARSGFGPDVAELMRLQPLSVDEVQERTGWAVPGYWKPYFDINGEPVIDNGKPYGRIRLFHSEPTGFAAQKADQPKRKKPPKYWQPNGSAPHLYLSPNLDWVRIAQGNGPLMVTEGAKKSMAAALLGKACIGIGGVWSWKSKTTGQFELLREFQQFNLKNRDIKVILDSDVRRNPNVLGALHAFARALANHGANPSTVMLPDEPGGVKQGLDDLLVAQGLDGLNALPAEKFNEIEALWDLNTQYAVFKDPTAVYEFRTEKFLTAHNFTTVSVADQRILQRNAKGELVPAQAGRAWLAWPQRRSYTRLAYEPGQLRDLEDGSYNLWKGFGVESIKGDPSPWLWWLDHVFDGGPDAERRWFQQWVAYPILHPGVKLFSAVVFFGEVQGSGKSFGGEILRRIYGLNNSSEIGGNEQVTAKFNSHLVNRQLLLANEVADQKHMRLDSTKLKAIITQEEVQLEKKGVDKISVRDCANWWITSNKDAAVYVDDYDRRYFFRKVAQKIPGKIVEALRACKFDPAGVGCSAIRYHIESTADFSDFKPYMQAYQTRDREAVIDAARSGLDNWVQDLKADPDTFLKLGNAAYKPRDLFMLEELVSACKISRGSHVEPNALGSALRLAGIPRTADRASTLRGRLRFWIVNHADRWLSASLDEIAKEYNSHLPEGSKY
jgi:hypothetical protein